ILELQREAVERAQDAADVELIGVRHELLRAAQGRRRREVELAIVEARHSRQPRAERIEPDDVRVHLAETQRQRVHALLQAAARLIEKLLLGLELGAPGRDLGARVGYA